MRTNSLRLGRWLLALVCVPLLLLTPGCASKGKIRGKVTMSNGEPLPGGTITFAPVSGKGNVATAWINPDGTYEVEAPTGECKVTIDNRNVGKEPPAPIGAGGGSGAATGGGAPKGLDDGKGAAKGPGPIGGGSGKGPPAGMVTGPPGGMKGAQTGPIGSGVGGKSGGGPPKEGGEIEAAMKAAGQAPSGASGQVQPGTYKPINPKYYSTETSGLTYTVKGGEQEHNIKLEP